MTMPLPDHPRAPNRRRTEEERERARVKLARKWAYLVSMTTYVPLVHTELEQPLLELVGTAFDAVAGDAPEAADAAGIGVRLVELHCVDKTSLQCSMDLLSAALLADPDLQRLDKLPERVTKVLGAMAAGFADAIRRTTFEQQNSMCRALMEVAKKAIRTTEVRDEQLEEMNTELSLLQRQLGHQLLHDALTGLPNRQFFTTRLEEVLNSGTPITVYRVELNGFTVINDGLGRPRADKLLTTVAVRLRAAVAGEKAMVARFENAGFAILQEHVPSAADPAAVVRRINDALAEPTQGSDLGPAAAANVGVVRSPPHGADPVELLRAADIALRHAKNKGPGQWQLLAPGDAKEDRRLLRLAAVMPGALARGQLEVGYRLRVRLTDDRPVGVDAFARWPDAEVRGRPRYRCADLAEHTGLGAQLGKWLLRSAGEQLRRSRSDLPLAVSLSPNQSSAPDLAETVLGILEDAALPATRLQLAMPAAEVFDGRKQAADNLALLAAAGVQTAVHDFGGGAGDPVRLAGLPVRAVWLTPHLVVRARQTDKDSLVANGVTGLIALVHLAGVSVGVDDLQTRAEANWWRRAQADTATGPVFSPRDEPTDITALFPEEEPEC